IRNGAAAKPPSSRFHPPRGNAKFSPLHSTSALGPGRLALSYGSSQCRGTAMTRISRRLRRRSGPSFPSWRFAFSRFVTYPWLAHHPAVPPPGLVVLLGPVPRVCGGRHAERTANLVAEHDPGDTRVSLGRRPGVGGPPGRPD